MGFFFFDIKIPDNYPFSPPVFKFKTKDPNKNVRFNPNLYKNGKVCLSIINTWDGPKWSPCNTIMSTIISIQSMVFVKNAITNEPGYENKSQNILKEYDDAVQYASLNIGVLEMLKNTPYGFYYFKNKIQEYFLKNYDWYINKCVSEENKTYNNELFNMKISLNYEKLKGDFEILRKSIQK
jgi:ubiquitin-conjugating enzyme E2 Z